MARPLRIEFQGAFYHITSRGNEKRNIYSSERDRAKFFDFLQTAHDRYRAVIHVYCLMGNHYHFILETPLGNLSRIMHFINCSYSAYYNAAHDRSGHFLQGRFKAILIEAESYIQALSRYIHLNPIRAGIVSSPEQYTWSSYREYVGLRRPSKWLKTEFLLNCFGKTEEEARLKYAEFVCSSINQMTKSPFEDMKCSAILGSDDFIDRFSETGKKGSG